MLLCGCYKHLGKGQASFCNRDTHSSCCLSGLSCGISTQLRDFHSFLPLNETSFSVIYNGGLYDFCLTRRLINVTSSIIILCLNGLSFALKVCRRYTTVYRTFLFGRRTRYTTRRTYKINGRKMLGLTSTFKDVIPYLIRGIQIYTCEVCFCTRYLRLIVFLYSICRLNETCRNGIYQVRRRGNPFAFCIFIKCYFRASILRDLGLRFERL